mmetsp:Transcript_100093/g.283367  ORF Transcript_100093/g.283367 Transcript_100093/m.283367 type:complete len:359 (+) Transcript_100093:1-1077(+)
MEEEPAPAAADAAEPVTFEALAARLRGTAVHAKLPEAGLGEFICTHHGNFHADEALACAMLKCLPAFAPLPILRTRDPAEIKEAAVVVDVGGTYDHASHRYDHHQPTFTDTYSESYPDIRLSSAGLVFKHFGGEVIEALCGPVRGRAQIEAKTYDTLIRELDAVDNGIQVGDPPRYRFVSDLSSRVGRLSPSWQETSTPELENAKFKEAMVLAARELDDVVRGYCDSWLPARHIVEDALGGRAGLHPSGEIMRLPRFCPWQDHLFDLEEESEASRTPLTKFVLFPGGRGDWRVQAVPTARGRFETRVPLLKAWWGLRDAELSGAAGIPGCVFVHANGFIGGNASESGALEMAAGSLAQ